MQVSLQVIERFMETMRTVKVSTKRKRRLDQQLATLDAKKKHLKEVMGHFNDPQDIIKNIKGQGLSASTVIAGPVISRRGGIAGTGHGQGQRNERKKTK